MNGRRQFSGSGFDFFPVACCFEAIRFVFPSDCITHVLNVFFSTPVCLIQYYYYIKMGKVHGSLARAGKVKGQTPKVEAQEDKKKQPRGRAKKRLQYNRRYVNVVTAMGGKRVGPNSNADKMK
jgi:small subunit ribosomal protein S30e